jgi:hypothetical protein
MVAASMISRPIVLTGPRRALGEQLDRLERLGVLRVGEVDAELREEEIRQLRRRLDALDVHNRRREPERQAK